MSSSVSSSFLARIALAATVLFIALDARPVRRRVENDAAPAASFLLLA